MLKALSVIIGWGQNVNEGAMYLTASSHNSD